MDKKTTELYYYCELRTPQFDDVCTGGVRRSRRWRSVGATCAKVVQCARVMQCGRGVFF